MQINSIADLFGEGFIHRDDKVAEGGGVEKVERSIEGVFHSLNSSSRGDRGGS